LRFDLVDRLNLWLYPLLLGSGTRVFADGAVPAGLRLIESVTYPSGTLRLADQTAGVSVCDNIAIEEQDLQRLQEMTSERGRRGSDGPEDPIGAPQHRARTAEWRPAGRATVGSCRHRP
jgi:hypothetical protein